MRVVCGVPVSWDPAIATVKYSGLLDCLAWSPCSRFIALDPSTGTQIQILDGVTLERLKSFAIPDGTTKLLTFSPEGRLLTWVGSGVAISWDVHTGVAVSKITIDKGFAHSITYSVCGTMFGVLFSGAGNSTAIGTYHVHPSTPTHYQLINVFFLSLNFYSAARTTGYRGGRRVA
jgi:WD40 repeat protein